MPITSIPFSPAVSAPSHLVQEVVDSIKTESSTLAGTVTPEGRVEVAKLRAVLEPVVTKHGLGRPDGDTFEVRELAWEDDDRAIAVAVQAGRAATNNGGLITLLAASARPGVDWLLLVLPEKYKHGNTYANVLRQIRALSKADGIDLDLIGVTLIAF